jgi:arginase
MVEAASLQLGYPETAVIDEGSLGEQTLALASDLPERPLVLGGCCCAHLGAVEGLAARHRRIAVVWLDAHGDLNTPESSPSGNQWGMPLRMALESGAVVAADVALVGARELDPPEQAFIEASGLHVGVEGVGEAVRGCDGVYVAIDADVFDDREVAPFMPEPGGLSVDAAARLLDELAASARIVGAGVTGLRPDPRNVAPVERLLAQLGF